MVKLLRDVNCNKFYTRSFLALKMQLNKKKSKKKKHLFVKEHTELLKLSCIYTLDICSSYYYCKGMVNLVIPQAN